MTLGFINHVSNHFIATQTSIESVRAFYPDAPIFLSVDGSYDVRFRNNQIADELLFNKHALGYPPYEKNQVLEWLKRMYIGVLKIGTDHFMMLEDDVIIVNPIQYDDYVECLGHNITHGNKIPDTIMRDLNRLGKYFHKTDYYGNGGGSIFKSSTFLENYRSITSYWDRWWNLYKVHFYPQCGYMDCYMTLFYMLAGKPYTPNTRMINIDPHDPEQVKLIKTASVACITELYKNDYDIVHGVKFYY